MSTNFLQEELYSLIQKESTVFEYIQKYLFHGLWFCNSRNIQEIWINERFWTMLGYNPLEMQNKENAWQDIIFKDDLHKTLDNIKKHSKNTATPFDQTTRYKHKNGSTIWIRSIGLVITVPKKTTERILIAHQDITAQKRTKSELEEAKKTIELNERRWDFALKNSKCGIWDWDIITNKVQYSDQWATMLGYQKHEIENTLKQWESLIHPDDIKQNKIKIEEYFTGKTNCYTSELRLKCKDKSYKWVLSRGKFTAFDSNENPIKMIGIHTDLTEKTKNEQEISKAKEKALKYSKELQQINDTLKKTIEKLEKSELQFRLLFENMEQGFALHKIIYDEKGNGKDYEFILLNTAFEKLTALSAAQCIGKTVLEIMPNTEKIWIENYTKVATEGTPLHFSSFSQEIDKYYDVVAYCPQKGYFATIFTDITALVKSENNILKAKKEAQEYANELSSLNEEYQGINEELLKTNELLKATIDDFEKSEFNLIKAQKRAHLGSWYLDLATNKVTWTEELYKMYGYDSKLPPPPYNEHAKLFWPQSWKKLSEALEKTKQTGTPYELELKMQKADGNTGWMWVSGEIVKNKNGKTTGLWGAAQDITKQKTIEEELKKAKIRAEKSESHLKEILDNLFEGYQIIDFNWKYLYVNKAAEIHNQRTKEELIGKKYTDCWPNIQESKIFELIKDCMEHRNMHRLENEYVFPDEEVRWFDIGIQPINDGVFILSNDITEKKRAEQKLLKEKIKAEANARQLKKAQKTAQVGNWIWNILENKFWWSDEVYNIFELNKKTFDGKLPDFFHSKIHPDDQHLIEQTTNQVIKTKEQIPIEYRIITKNNTIKYLYSTADEIITDKNGECKIITGITKDITEFKLVQLQLEEAKIDAEKSNHLKSAFLANMSHEIRTPMNAITGFATFLKDRSFSRDEIDKYADIIISSGNHLLNLINDIIDISKIDAGQVIICKESVDITALLRELHSLFHSNLTSKNKLDVKLKINVPNVKILANTDKTRLRQILINLLGNAIKFTDKGEIEFGYTIKSNKVHFFVRDTGIGISKNKQEVIFERFHQGADTTEKLYGGTGLGLAIAKACTHLLNGKIWVESEIKKGTTFFFTIEYEPTTEEKIVQKPDINKTFCFHGESILIAEDDNYNFEYLHTVLSKYDLKIIRTKTGRETIEQALTTNEIKLVLMDIQMPDLTGSEATIEIKKHKPSLPIIAQTAYALNDDRKKFLEIGCNEYISKPINRKQLLELLNSILNNS